MKNLLSEDLNAPRESQFQEVDQLAAEIKAMLEQSRVGMERVQRADRNIEHQLRELERQIKCSNG